MSKIKRIYDIMLQYEERHPDQKLALSGKIGKNKWNEYTPQLFKKTANELSCALIAKGIQKGDKVAVISTNRPEWTITQMAVTQIGAVLVPIYPTITAEDYQYILQHCGAKLVILEGEIVMRKVQSVATSTRLWTARTTLIGISLLPWAVRTTMRPSCKSCVRATTRKSAQ